MKTKAISNFINGLQPLRSQVAGGCSSSRHFMLESTKLVPYRTMEADTIDGGMTMADKQISHVIRYKCTGQAENIYGLGQVSDATPYPKFFVKSTTNTPNVDFSALANGEDTTGVVIPSSLIGYKGYLFALKTKSGSVYLIRHEHGVAITEIGSIATSPTNSVGAVPQMFIHPKDNKLYGAVGNTAFAYDGTTLSTRAFSTEHEVTSVTHFGNNILLGMIAKNGSGSVVAVWDGSVTSSVLVDVVTWGSDTLMVLENIGDVVVGVSSMAPGGTTDVATQSFVTIRYYIGGTAQTLKKIESIGGSRIYPLKAKRNDTLYFPASVVLNGTTINQIWAIYKNESGVLTITPDRKANGNTEVAANTFTGISMIGDWMWIAFADSLMRTADQTSEYTSTSSWTSLVNPQMDVEDRSKIKTLKAISLRCGSPSGASHTVTVSYSADGGSFTTIYTGSSSSIVRVIEEVAESTGVPFLGAREYIFKIESTGNGEIYEFKYGYEVIPSLI